MARCRSCKAEIIWEKLESGKPHPCDVPNAEYWSAMPGETVVVKIVGRPAFIMTVPEEGPLVEVFRTHFATCPDAKDWSKK